MGVKGLKTFIENNEDTFMPRHNLSGTTIIVDANNFKLSHASQCQMTFRRDLFGGDLVEFEKYARKTISNFVRCRIEPIFVYDGAKNIGTDKTPVQQRRTVQRFREIRDTILRGHGRFILPDHTDTVMNCLLREYGFKIVSSMFEADLVIARLALEHRCPVLSDDSDFLLMDLPYGVVSCDSLNYRRVYRDTTKSPHQFCMECNLYTIDRFVTFFPKLDKKLLPLLGILCGNDFVNKLKFDRICSDLPDLRPESQGPVPHLIIDNPSQEKVVRIIYFLCDKTLEQSINQICERYPEEKRNEVETFIWGNIASYRIPVVDNYELELRNLLMTPYMNDHSRANQEPGELEHQFERALIDVYNWLKTYSEDSFLPFKLLEILHRNIIFLRPKIDDCNLDSSHACIRRVYGILTTLTRSHRNDSSSPTIFDRMGQDLCPQEIVPIEWLDKFGTIDYTIYDIPRLPEETRRGILLATFNCSIEDYANSIDWFHDWLEPQQAEEYFLIKLLLDHINIDSTGPKLWGYFCQATLLCALYYFHQFDRKLPAMLERSSSRGFMRRFSSFIGQSNLTLPPLLSSTRRYNIRLMHQISQLNSAVSSFILMNSFLGDTMARLRPGTWLNCCLIYNIADLMWLKRTNFGRIPLLVHRRLNLG